MSAKYEPGMLAAVSTHVTESARAVRRGGVWHFLDDEGYALDAYVSDVRPLVVLDLKDPAAMADTLRKAANQSDWFAAPLVEIADQIEAQSRPPKPAEPTGLGAVVEDASGAVWVLVPRDGNAAQTEWVTHHSTCRTWDAIDAVRVLSEGVQP